MLRVAVPVPSRLTSKVTGLEVEPEWLAPGTNGVILRIEPLDRDTMLHGSLWLCASSEQERKIVVDGHVLRAPDGNPSKTVAGLGRLNGRSSSRSCPSCPFLPNRFRRNRVLSLSQLSSSLPARLSGRLAPRLSGRLPPRLSGRLPPPPVRPPAPAVVAQPIKVGFPQSLAKESVDERRKGAADLPGAVRPLQRAGYRLCTSLDLPGGGLHAHLVGKTSQVQVPLSRQWFQHLGDQFRGPLKAADGTAEGRFR